MRTTTDEAGDPPSGSRGSPHLKQIGWFVILWLGGVAVVSAVAYAIRAMILP